MFAIDVVNTRNETLPEKLRDSMFQLRKRVFFDRLRWSVHCEGECEYDMYDALTPVYLVAHTNMSDAPHAVIGCWRLLPTIGPYMLRDVFPELLGGHPAPMDLWVWEISRFAIDERYGSGGYGFSELPVQMLGAMVRFAAANGITAIVGVTSVAVERMLLKLGFEVQRYAPPHRIGRVMSVGFRLPLTPSVRLHVCQQAFGAKQPRRNVASDAGELPIHVDA